MDMSTAIKIEPTKESSSSGDDGPKNLSTSEGGQSRKPVAVVTPQPEHALTDEEPDGQHMEEESPGHPYSDGNPHFPPQDHEPTDGQTPGSFRQFYPFPSEKGRMYFRSWRNLTHQRRLFSTEQLVGLKAAFEENAYPSRRQFEEIAERLKMKEKSVRLWFQNRRARLRKSGNVKDTDVARSSVRVRDSIPKQSRGNPSSLPACPTSVPANPYLHAMGGANMYAGTSPNSGGPEMGEITPEMRKHLNHLRDLANRQKTNNNSQNEATHNETKLDYEMERRRESYRKRMQSNPYFKYYTNLSGMRPGQSPPANTHLCSPDSIKSEKSNSPSSTSSHSPNLPSDDQPLDLSMKKSTEKHSNISNNEHVKQERSETKVSPGQMHIPLMMPFVPPWMYPMASHPGFAGFRMPGNTPFTMDMQKVAKDNE